MATFSVRFLGCKVSQADAMLIRDALYEAGHTETSRDSADVHIINTCALTVEAERKSRQQVNRSVRQNVQTFVTGCAANLNATQFETANVTVVGRSADRAAAEIVGHLADQAALGCREPIRVAGRTRAFLKVQNGCDQRCSFCIIPRTRGPAESRELDRILRDATRRVAEGHPELVLTGINIGTWRASEGGSLATLVDTLCQLDGLKRLRISSIEPGTVTSDLVQAMVDNSKVARHLHIPLQSGDDEVLAGMGRSYRVDQYISAVQRVKDALPDINLTTDVIVGYPTETDAAFRRTLELCEELRFGKIHVFPFSPRPGTVAADIGDHVPAATKDQRSAALRDLSDRSGFARRAERVGSTDHVMVERELDDGTLTGYTSDYLRCVLDPGCGLPGDLVSVALTGMVGEHLRAERRR